MRDTPVNLVNFIDLFEYLTIEWLEEFQELDREDPDIIRNPDRRNRVRGTRDNDFIDGEDRGDRISGRGGSDELLGGDGN
ncbi:MAG: hypothetical protein F6K39_47750, partial [Okeania sp. SIO3B3]|nr:hypothetical protein [Okeania sp. SIO3B3]